LDCGGHIDAARNEDNWHFRALDGYALLQVETVKARKKNVKDKTIRNDGWRTPEEFLWGCKCFGPPAVAADKQFQRFAYSDVAIDNEDDGCGMRCLGKSKFVANCARSKSTLGEPPFI
jgi:hypothetical protein